MMQEQVEERPIAPRAPTRATTMRAAVHDRYGDASVLRVATMPVPSPNAGEILVRVHAASLNPADKFMMLGRPAPLRLMMGLTRPGPKHRVRGHDLAGTVAAVGEGVSRFRVGEEVFGSAEGALADYVRGPHKACAAKPPSLSFEQAAALPMAALAALHGVRDAAGVRSGDHVLVNGAAGGIGTFAVQLAKYFGAEVTGVCSTNNAELVRSLGADHVMDYTKAPITSSERRFDVIFDNVGNHSLAALRALLAPDGTLLPNSGEAGPDGGPIARMVKERWQSLRSRQRIRSFLSRVDANDLAWLAERAAAGELTAVIDGVYPLEEVADAMRRLATRHARGKVIVKAAD